MPLYRKLLASDAARRLRIVVAGREHADDLRDYLAANGIPTEGVEFVRFRKGSAFRHEPVPAVFVIDERRTITAAWVGKLTGDREAELLECVKRAAGELPTSTR